MKKSIKELYNIEVLTFIKISDKVYRVKTSDKDYALKYIDKVHLDSIIEKLKIIKIDSFVYPIKNIYNQYVSSIEDIHFMLSPWVEEDVISVQDLKLKFYLENIANLHNKSFYTAKVNGKFFDETYDFIANKIDKMESYLEKYMSEIERIDYKSPSQWLFILNYPVYDDCIRKANKYLDRYKEKCKNKTSVRLAFTYNDFDYKHISLKEEKILGIENIEVTSPIYDIYYTFISLNEISVDTKMYYEEYFKKFILEDYEKDWLLSLLYIPRIENLSNNEVNNIKEVISSLNYIKNSEDIAQTIVDKDIENV